MPLGKQQLWMNNASATMVRTLGSGCLPMRACERLKPWPTAREALSVADWNLASTWHLVVTKSWGVSAQVYVTTLSMVLFPVVPFFPLLQRQTVRVRLWTGARSKACKVMTGLLVLCFVCQVFFSEAVMLCKKKNASPPQPIISQSVMHRIWAGRAWG